MNPPVPANKTRHPNPAFYQGIYALTRLLLAPHARRKAGNAQPKNRLFFAACLFCGLALSSPAGFAQSTASPQTIAISDKSTLSMLPPTGVVSTCVWSKVSGPGTATFVTPTAFTTDVSFNQYGVYRLKADVTAGGVTTSSSVDVTVERLISVKDGRLAYTPHANADETAKVNVIPDFSRCGYRAGGVAIPQVPTKITLTPTGTSADRAAIQNAINTVSAMPLDANGFRGAVLLKAGTFFTSDAYGRGVSIRASGVVVRGEGQGPGGTKLMVTTDGRHNSFNVAPSAGPSFAESGTTRIADAYVGAGAMSFRVVDASGLQAGDTVRVYFTPNATWLTDIRVNDFLQADDTLWTTATYTIPFERAITKIIGNEVFLDSPVVVPMQTKYGGGEVRKIVRVSGNRLNNVGIENLSVSCPDGAADKNRISDAVYFNQVENSWISGVTVYHQYDAAVSLDNSRYITVQDCASLKPVGPKEGGYRYTYYIGGGSNHCLVQRCYAYDGRHDFVTYAYSPGPNVFLDCLSQLGGTQGPHQRFASGMLFDNITSATQLAVSENRGTSGSGHGWTGVTSVSWNSTASFTCDAPKGFQNYAIGSVGSEVGGDINNSHAYVYRGLVEDKGTRVATRSLYLKQLEDRLGTLAVDAVTTPAQRSGSFQVYPKIPSITPSVAYLVNGQAQFQISSDYPGAVIRYTTDGSQPTVTSPVYTPPLVINQVCTIKASAFDAAGRNSPVAQAVAAAPVPTITSLGPVSGTTAGGTTVTITGTNLTGTTAVTFGGTVATGVTVVSATSVTCVTPAKAAGAVNVVLTAPGGSVTKTAGYTFVAPAPTLTSLSPVSGTTAGGTTVTIIGTNLTGTTAVTFGGTAATGVTVVSATSVTCVTPAKAAGAVDVVLTAPGGSATKTAGYAYVTPLGTLAVSPAGGLTSTGGYGGPFAPASQAYTLSNIGSTAINWTLTKSAAWVNLSATSGSLAAGASATVTVSINSAANALAAGSYSDTFTFANTTNSNGNTTRSFVLTINAPPNVNASQDQVIYLSTTPWSPQDLSPRLWLDASKATINAGTVSITNAGTGGGSVSGPASLTANGIGNLQAVRFSGISQYLTGGYTNTGNTLSAFFVGKSASATQTAYAGMMSVWANGQANEWDNVGSAVLFNQNNATSNSIQTYRNAALSATTGTLTNPFVAATVFSGSTHTMFLNGTTANVANSSGNFNVGNVVLGSRMQGSAFNTGWNGSFGEAISYNTQISDADRQKTEGYLAHKWGFAASLPAAHPYKVAPPGPVVMATLNGTASDLENTPLVIAWSKVSGPGTVVFSNTSAASTQATFSVEGVYTLRLTASDGTTQTSDDVVITVMRNNLPIVNAGSDQTIPLVDAPWTPANLTTTGWYDASDASTITASSGLVSQWRDKSGNALHLSASAGNPQTGSVSINGRNALDFTGDIMTTASNPFGATVHNALVIAVHRVDTVNSGVLFSLTGSMNTANRWQPHAPYSDGIAYFDTGGAVAPNRVSAGFGVSNNTVVLSGFYGSTTDNVQQVFKNGSLLVGDNGGHAVTTAGNIRVGGLDTSYQDTSIAEMIIINGTVSVSNRQKLEGYLAHKWGLAASLPIGHPHKAAAPVGRSAMVNLDATVSDPDGNPLTTSWTVISSPAGVTFANASAVDTIAIFPVVGTYTLRLTANDGTYQVFDSCVITVNPGVMAVDTDSDGMEDGWEITHFGGLGASNGTADGDGDGFTDQQEYRCGTDPTDSKSALKIASTNTISTTEMVLTFHAVAGKTYKLMASPNLTVSSWQPIQTGIIGVSPTTSVSVPIQGNAMFFMIGVE
ncbi:MAG: IPT/TIG domain-containing protein [Verrucomicrobiota bacterium]